MMTNNPSLDLVEFIETQILPQYAAFDKAHNMEHVTRVIRRSLDLARKTGADLDMAYTIAAYHDLGLSGPRAIHVEDHRASASRAPRSIYGKIVAEADRDIDPQIVIRRTIQFGIANYPQLDTEGHWRRFMQHMDEKYSVNGYIRLWIQGSENEKKLNELRQLIVEPHRMREIFDRIFAEER